jgi:hypothetical protein
MVSAGRLRLRLRGSTNVNHRSTTFWHDVRMPNEHPFTLRQVDQARTGFAIIEDELEAIHARLARLPTRVELARTALMTMIGAAGLVIMWFEAFWPHCL